MIAVWEGYVVAGSDINHPSAFLDIILTFADVAGFEAPEGIEGISFLATLPGEGNQKDH